MLFSNKTHKSTCPSFPYTNTAHCMTLCIFVLCSETCRYWPPVVHLKPWKIKKVASLQKIALKSHSFASILTSYEPTHCVTFVICFTGLCNPAQTTYSISKQWFCSECKTGIYTCEVQRSIRSEKQHGGTINWLRREGATWWVVSMDLPITTEL